MPTVVTDKTDFLSIQEIIKQFGEDEQVDVYSSKISSAEQAIATGTVQISQLIVQPDNDKMLFVMNNGTVIERKISQLSGLSSASEAQLKNFENMGDGVLWHDLPQVDLSLKKLLEEEIFAKYNLKVV